MTADREELPWQRFGSAAAELAERVAADGFTPDLILAVARGGLFVAGALAYELGVKNVAVINVEFYTGVDERLDMPVVLPPVPNTVDLAGARVLIADDVADTGETLRLVRDFCADHVADARCAVLYQSRSRALTANTSGAAPTSGSTSRGRAALVGASVVSRGNAGPAGGGGIHSLRVTDAKPGYGRRHRLLGLFAGRSHACWVSLTTPRWLQRFRRPRFPEKSSCRFDNPPMISHAVVVIADVPLPGCGARGRDLKGASAELAAVPSEWRSQGGAS